MAVSMNTSMRSDFMISDAAISQRMAELFDQQTAQAAMFAKILGDVSGGQSDAGGSSDVLSDIQKVLGEIHEDEKFRKALEALDREIGKENFSESVTTNDGVFNSKSTDSKLPTDAKTLAKMIVKGEIDIKDVPEELVTEGLLDAIIALMIDIRLKGGIDEEDEADDVLFNPAIAAVNEQNIAVEASGMMLAELYKIIEKHNEEQSEDKVTILDGISEPIDEDETPASVATAEVHAEEESTEGVFEQIIDNMVDSIADDIEEAAQNEGTPIIQTQTDATPTASEMQNAVVQAVEEFAQQTAETVQASAQSDGAEMQFGGETNQFDGMELQVGGAELQSDSAEVRFTVAEGQTDVAEAVETNAAEVQSNVAAVQTNVAAVQTNVAEVQTDVAEVQTGVAQVQTNVAQVQTNVADVQTNVAEVQTDVAQVQTDVVEVETDTAEVKTDVAQVQPNNAEVKTDVAERLPEIAEKPERLEMNEIGEIDSVIESFTAKEAEPQTENTVRASSEFASRVKNASEELEMLKNAKLGKDENKPTETTTSLLSDQPIVFTRTDGSRIEIKPTEIVDQTMKIIQQAIEETQEQSEYSLVLNPEELGRITVKLIKAADGAVSVTIAAENAHTQRVLEQHSELMQNNLRSNGVNLEHWQTVSESRQEAYAQDYSGSSKNPYFRRDDAQNDDEDTGDRTFADIIAAM